MLDEHLSEDKGCGQFPELASFCAALALNHAHFVSHAFATALSRLTLTAFWAASLLPATTVRGPPMPQRPRRCEEPETGTVETAKS